MPYRKQVTYSRRPNMAARRAHRESYDQFRQYDTHAIRPKRNNMSLPALIGIVAAVLVVVLAVALFQCSSTSSLAPDGTQVAITVNDGDSAQTIGKALADGGLVKSDREFTDEVSKEDAGSSLKPGSYTIVAGTSVSDIVAQLEAGPVKQTVTVTEGATVSQVASAVEQATDGQVGADDFTSAAHNAQTYQGDYPFVADAYDNSLEGFLSPATYDIDDDETADSLVRKMLDQYSQVQDQLDYSYAEAHGLSHYDVLTLASMIEKEAAADNRGQVSSVFYNRMAAGMPLQSDATTAYVVGHSPTPDDLAQDNPYNTYTNQGLPAGPICSPGADSLKAACSPDQTDYLYFYFQNNDDGTTTYSFSRTYEEHQNAIGGMGDQSTSSSASSNGNGQ